MNAIPNSLFQSRLVLLRIHMRAVSLWAWGFLRGVTCSLAPLEDALALVAISVFNTQVATVGHLNAVQVLRPDQPPVAGALERSLLVLQLLRLVLAQHDLELVLESRLEPLRDVAARR